MHPQQPSFPFRWVLPSAQLVLCMALLWPVRTFLLFGVMGSIASYSNPNLKLRANSDSKGVDIIVPPLTPEVQRRLTQWEIRKTAPLALNFPVLITQLPYILASPAKREWVPKGMFPDVWRALSWPFAGMLFWWSLGRAVEALSAARRFVVRPRISWAETAFAIALLAIGFVALVGILTSTPDDRRDIQFLSLAAGGLLWGILATATIGARLLQWRIAKRSAAAQSTLEPSPG